MSGKSDAMMSGWTAKKIGLLSVFAVLAAVIGIWAWQMSHALSGETGPMMEVGEAHRKAGKGEIVLVDVRRPSEWKASGVPATGHAITMHQDGAGFVRQLLAATGGSYDRPLALICATGGRTSWLQPRLRKAGFTNLYNVAEGMMGSGHGRGWLKKGLPVRRWTGPGSALPAN